MDKDLLKQVWKVLLFLIGVVAFSRMSSGGGIALLIVLSAISALSGKVGWFMVIFMMIPFMTEMSSELTGRGALFHYGARVAVFSSTILLLIRFALSKGRYSIPIGGIFLYITCATISSIQGYCPPVSYLKLLNYSVFMLGLYFGGRMVSENPKDLYLMRAALLAFAIVLIFGSLVMLGVPSIGYMSMNKLAAQGYTEKQIAETIAEGGLNLFCGILNHSQTLATSTVIMLGWVVCDMLFVAHRVTRLHGLLILGALPILYLTRSRAALLGVLTLGAMITLYSIPQSALPISLRNKSRRIFGVFSLIAVLCAICMQIKGGGMSKWIRKTEQNYDDRGLVEAVTESRINLVEQNMYDFNRNIFLGSGFQVSQDVADAYQQSEGLTISAPIEKGVLPLMVLGEGGVLGGVAFLIFLVMFYRGCTHNKYVATATLFTVYLFLNMAEASFFSPNGGGAHWVEILVGGYVIDMYGRVNGLRQYYAS